MAYVVGKFKYHSVNQGDEGLVLPYQEGAAQTFKAGEIVKLSSGKIIVATEASADLLLGYALADASGVTDTIVSVQVIRPSDVFIVPYEADDTFVITDVGVSTGYGAKRTNNKWMINNDNTTAAQVVFHPLASIEYDARQLLGATAGGAAYVRFNTSNLQFSVDV